MAVKYRDYYETLGVARSAAQDEIKAAYRKLARKYHPDVNKAKDAEERFKDIGEAYEVLGDPEKRRKYDQLGANWRNGQDFTPPQGWAAGAPGGPGGQDGFFTDVSDFFETLFGRGFKAHTNFDQDTSDMFGRRMRERPGEDQEVRLTIPLEVAYWGSEQNITLKGQSRGSDGKLKDSERVIRLKIPAGVTDGTRLRITGQGRPGSGGGSSGDLYLELRLEPHGTFRAEGRDLYTSLALAPWEAALGATVELNVFGDSVSVTVPPGTSSGQKLRLRGKGLPGSGSADPGDMYVEVKIVLPKAPTAKERELWEKLAAQSKFKPREK